MERAVAHPTFVVCHSEWFRNKMVLHSSVPGKRCVLDIKKKKIVSKEDSVVAFDYSPPPPHFVPFSVIYVRHHNSLVYFLNSCLSFFSCIIPVKLYIFSLQVYWLDRLNQVLWHYAKAIMSPSPYYNDREAVHLSRWNAISERLQFD